MQIPESPHNSCQRLSIATHFRMILTFSAKIYNFHVLYFCIFFSLKKKNKQKNISAEPSLLHFFVNVITKEKKRNFTKLVARTFQQKNRHLAQFFFQFTKKHPAITNSHDLDFQVNSSTKAFFFVCSFLFIWLKNLEKKKCHKALTHFTKILIAV